MFPILSSRSSCFAPRLAVFALWLSTLCLSSVAHAATLTVPAQYPTIQAAVNASGDGDTVLVADGTYSGDGNRDIDFNGKNITVTSVNGPTKTIIDCGGVASTDGSGNHRGFYIHSGGTNAIISGFAVENGYETYVSSISDSGTGGAVYVANNSNKLTLNNCTLSGNTAQTGGGISNNSTLTLINCTLSGNTAFGGGGIRNTGTLTLTNCILSGNTATEYGGGIFNYSNTITLTNSVLSGNSAGQDSDGGGGGIYNESLATLTNCTLSENTANGVSHGGGIYNEDTTGTLILRLANDILYNDNGEEIYNSSQNKISEASYCDVQGGYTGTGNIDADPLFVRNPNPTAMPPDYGDLHLQPGSPCLGAGTATGAPTTTIDGYTRPNPPSIGAYELAPVPVPTNLTATAGPGKVTLSWTAPAGVSGAKYNLYRGTTSGGETLYYSNVPTTSFVNTIVTAGTKYYYTVKTVVGSQLSVASNEASATPTGGTVPAAPTNLKAVAGDTKVTLTWTAPAGTVTSYTLSRGTSATALTVYKSGLTTTSFTNALVTNGTTYYYAVAAVNSVGSSPQSAVVSATPLAVPSAPTHLTATASGGKITLTWTASTGTVSSYSVYRGTTSGGETFYKTANTSTTFVNTYVTAGTKYYYYIKALNASGTSAASNEASATP